ncbi:MAG TPA: efflux RND transporter periplasmic adaptor subunit [Kofleriaceae bacterium]|nr:efflux RND transporter periplasmic adaptor subunit [Kofleriaceae bacterium]
MKRLVWILIVFAACKKSASESEGEDEVKPVSVVCEPAQAGAVADRVTLRGIVGAPPDKDAIVAAAVAGRLLEVKVKEGDRVKAGDPIATVDDPALAPAVKEADAAVAAARAAQINADAALARAKRLLDQGIAPRRDVEDAEARAAGAASEVAAADARRDVAARQLARAKLTAPIAGVVVHVMKRAGELVDGTPATPVAEIADPTSLEIKADAPAADLVRIKDGAKVTLELDALPGTTLDGTVLLVSPAVDPATSLGTVRVAIDPSSAKDVSLKLGLAGKITIPVAARANAITVPATAVRRSTDGGEEVVVCEKADKGFEAKVTPVETGAHMGDRIEIREGLEAGQPIAVRHVVGLADGTPLEIEK